MATPPSGRNVDRLVVRDRDDPHGSLRGIVQRRPFCRWALRSPSAEHLARFGPFIPVGLRRVDADEPLLRGALMVDTAASRTGITVSAAADLSLESHGTAPMSGFEGTSECRLFRVRLLLSLWEGEKHMPFRCVLEMGELADLPILDGVTMDGGRPRFLGLLGRDFLQYASFIYDGPTGLFELRMSMKDAERMADE